MSEEQPLMEDELDERKDEINKWIISLSTLEIPESRKSVIDRFIRDCRQFLNDIDSVETPTSADLVDFTDRHNSFEIQYFNITNELR